VCDSERPFDLASKEGGAAEQPASQRLSHHATPPLQRPPRLCMHDPFPFHFFFRPLPTGTKHGPLLPPYSCKPLCLSFLLPFAKTFPFPPRHRHVRITHPPLSLPPDAHDMRSPRSPSGLGKTPSRRKSRKRHCLQFAPAIARIPLPSSDPQQQEARSVVPPLPAIAITVLPPSQPSTKRATLTKEARSVVVRRVVPTQTLASLSPVLFPLLLSYLSPEAWFMLLHTSKTFSARVKAGIPRVEAATIDSPAAAMASLLLLRAVPVELPRMRGLTLALPCSSSAMWEKEVEEEEVEEKRSDAMTPSKDGKDSSETSSSSSSSPGSSGGGTSKITSVTTKTEGSTTITTITTTTTTSNESSSSSRGSTTTNNSSSSTPTPSTTSIDPPPSYRHHYLTSAVLTLLGQGKMRGLRKLALENVYFPYACLNPYGKTMHSLKHALGTGRHLTCLRKLVLSGCVIASAEDRESLAEVLVKESARTLPHLRVLKCIGGLRRASVAGGGDNNSSSRSTTAATATATATKTKKERAEEEEAAVAGAVVAFLPVLLDALRRGACPTLRRLVLEGHRWEKETMEGLRAAMVAREGGRKGKAVGDDEREDGKLDGTDKERGTKRESQEEGIGGVDAREENDKTEKEVTEGKEGGMAAPRLQAMPPANVKIEPLQELSLRDCSFAYYAFEVLCEMVGDALLLPQWRLLDLRGAEERFVTKEALDGWLEARRRGGSMRVEIGHDEEMTWGWEGEDEEALLLNDVRVDFQW